MLCFLFQDSCVFCFRVAWWEDRGCGGAEARCLWGRQLPVDESCPSGPLSAPVYPSFPSMVMVGYRLIVAFSFVLTVIFKQFFLAFADVHISSVFCMRSSWYYQAIDSIHQVGVYCLALVPANTLPKAPLGGIHISETKQRFLEGALHPCNVLMCPHTCVTNLPKPRQKQPGRCASQDCVDNLLLFLNINPFVIVV